MSDPKIQTGQAHPLGWMFGVSAPTTTTGTGLETPATTPPPTTAEPIAPSVDPWYSAPPDLASAVPGTILRIRPLPGNLITVLQNVSAAYNILYRTTNSRHQPTFAVTTLFLPKQYHLSPKTGRSALLTYCLTYNTANTDASPSYSMILGPSQGNADLGIDSDHSIISRLTGHGWLVNAPDWEGPDAAFFAGVMAGHATIDSVRACLHMARLTGSPRSDKGKDFITAIWGYSGGSMAAGSAAELAPRYAPELQLDGVVLGGIAERIMQAASKVNESMLAYTIVAGLVGLATQYPEITEHLRKTLVPDTADEFWAVRETSAKELLRRYAFMDIFEFFVNGEADVQAPFLKKIYDVECQRGLHGVPSAPMFIYKAIDDQFCDIAVTDRMVSWYASLGSDIKYERNTAGGHLAEIANGWDRAVEWLGSVFDESRVPAPEGGDVRDVTVQLTDMDS